VLDTSAMTADGAVGAGLFALKLADGKQTWHAAVAGCGDHPRGSPAQSAASVVDSIVFFGSVDGHLLV
jgi:outer membrane protein assembly factor BamB